LAPHPSLGKYVSTRMDTRSNSITVTAYDRTHADRICQLHQIPRENSTPFEIEALHLRPRGTSRGVIRVDPVGTNESLKDNVDCEHAAVLDVKRMGRSNFAIVSFDTPRLPKTVRYFTELCSVSPYVPRTLVCFHCHKDGHLQGHCPNAAVCKTCGKQQHEGACATPAAYCTLCTADGHLATDPKCPEPERRLEENKKCTSRRHVAARRRTANAAAAPAMYHLRCPVNFATSCTSATPVAGTTYATATSGKPKRSKKASARTKQEVQELTTRICELQQRLEELYQVQKEQEQEKRGSTNSSSAKRGVKDISNLAFSTTLPKAAVFVRKDIHHCQIDTTSFGTEYQEVVAVRIHLARGRALLVASAYVRPGGGRNRSDNYQWLSRLRTLYPLDEEEANDADLFLINDLDYPTRLGLHSGQRNTTPDLTWATRETIREWRCNGDPWSSDHFPRRKKVTYVDWEKYREFIQESEEASFHVKILQASALATRSIELDAETPAPDKHLLNLWTTREQLHDQYVQRDKTHTDLVRVRHKTAQIRRHSRHLETGLRKLWGTYQALSDKKKTQGVVETVLLTQGMSHLEFEEEAANTFFPQPARTPPASIYEPEPVNETNELETPFTPAELHTALEQVRVQSAPGKDGVTWTMLWNLPAQEKETLLDTVNEIWVSGQLPPWMKHAVVVPIPKAVKRPNEIPNLRPMSLTSTICKLLERLCLNRLNHHLEEVSFFFHPHQTGFRPNLSTQDSIYLLRRLLSTKRGRRQTVPSILVAVDLKKAFDSVTHEALIRDLREAYSGKRMLNIIKSFLCNRTFEVRSGRTEPKQFSSCVGVPQGAILSPLLFNLELIHGIRFTLYADDITIWESAVAAIQAALAALHDYLRATGMKISVEKTQHILLGGSAAEQAKVTLTIGGASITRSDTGWIRILGIPISERGGAVEWLKQLTPTWKKIVHIIKRISNKFGGATSKIARTLVYAVLVSRATYGAVCFQLTKTQVKKLETLYRAALRVITGLPRHTRVEELYHYGRLPPLRDIIQDCREGTQDRRLLTLQGQRLLLSDDPTMAAILDEVPPHVPPWKDFPVTDGRPLSRKTNAQRYGPQRATIARALNEPSTDSAEMRLFTDASWNPHTQIAAIVARTEDGCHRRQNCRLDETPSTTEVELRALQAGINWILTDPRIVSEQTKTITIYTDSSTAIRALLGPPRVGTTEYAIKNGCRIIKAQKDVAVKIQWVPGHSGQADNEAAHDLASEACTSRRSQGVPIYRPSLDHSPEEERRRRKQIRKSRLKDHVPPLENPLPRGLPRGAQVLVVNARTGFAITEDRMAKWRYNQLCHQEGDPPPPPVKRCSSCSADQAPTIRHLIWECDGLKDVREKHRPPGDPLQIDERKTDAHFWSDPPETVSRSKLPLLELDKAGRTCRRPYPYHRAHITNSEGGVHVRHRFIPFACLAARRGTHSDSHRPRSAPTLSKCASVSVRDATRIRVLNGVGLKALWRLC
ncbi:hypothetical protein HPB47_011219, partial [Ixodes persulcatus]